MLIWAKNAIRRALPKKAFIRAVSVLAGGTAASQLLLLLAAPFLTRLYTPEDFGLLAVFAGLLALISVASCLRYELAIPLPEDEKEAVNIAFLCLILVIASSLLTAILVISVGESIAIAIGVPHLIPHLWLLPVGVLVSGAYSVFTYWGIRTKRFTAIAATKLRQAFAMLAIQLSAFKLGGVALLFGQVVGQGVGTTNLALSPLKTWDYKSITKKRVWTIAIRYQRFPLFSTWSSALNVGGTQLPPLFLAGLFGVGAAGLYALTHRILTFPVSLIGQAVSQVFLIDGIEANRNRLLGEKVDQVVSILSKIAIPPTFLIIIFGPDLFDTTFGAPWRQAGEFARWMAPWLFFQFCMSPLPVFIILERQDLSLYMQIILFSLRGAALIAGYLVGDLALTIIMFSLASAFGYGMFLLIKLHISKASIGRATWHMLKSFAQVSICFSPALIFLWDGVSNRLSIAAVILILACLVFYYIQIKNQISR